MDDRLSISFEVTGTPATQGSKNPIVPTYKKGVAAGLPVRRHGPECPGRTTHGAYIDGSGRELCRCPIMVNTRDDNDKLESWRETVGWYGRAAMRSRELLSGLLIASFEFTSPRPKSHYGTGKNERILKDWAPAAPGVRPDGLKLARAVEDALTNVVYTDDSLIVTHLISKRYCHRWEPEMLRVTILPCDAQTVSDLVTLGLLSLPNVREQFGQLDLLDALATPGEDEPQAA